jgi:hypothetical protein
VHHDLANGTDIGGDDGQTDDTRYAEHHRQAVAQGGQTEDVRRVVQRSQLRAVGLHVVVHDHAGFGVDATCRDEVHLERRHRCRVQAAGGLSAAPLALKVTADEDS